MTTTAGAPAGASNVRQNDEKKFSAENLV